MSDSRPETANETGLEEVRERAQELYKCDMCAGSGQVMHYGRNHGPCAKCQGAGADDEAIEKAVKLAQSEREAEMELCCKDVCYYCRAERFYETAKAIDGVWWHVDKTEEKVNEHCRVAAIRERWARKREG